MTNPLFDLTGRTALVTGSSRGLGHAIALGMAEAGAAVIINGVDAARVEATVAEFKAKVLADLVRTRRITYEVGLEKCHHIEDFNRLCGRA